MFAIFEHLQAPFIITMTMLFKKTFEEGLKGHSEMEFGTRRRKNRIAVN